MGMREGEKFLEEPTTIGDLTNKTKPKFCLTANKKKKEEELKQLSISKWLPSSLLLLI